MRKCYRALKHARLSLGEIARSAKHPVSMSWMSQRGRLMDHAKSASRIATSNVLTILFTTHRSQTGRFAFSAESSGFHGSSPDSSKPALDARKVFGSGVVAAGKKEGGGPEGPPLPNLLIALAISTGAGEEIRTLDPNLGKVVLYP